MIDADAEALGAHAHVPQDVRGPLADERLRDVQCRVLFGDRGDTRVIKEGGGDPGGEAGGQREGPGFVRPARKTRSRPL